MIASVPATGPEPAMALKTTRAKPASTPIDTRFRSVEIDDLTVRRFRVLEPTPGKVVETK
jgi:hypothetical protein